MLRSEWPPRVSAAGTLFAVRFDLDRLETVGQAVPVLQDVAGDSTDGSAQVAFSATGTLAYVPGTVASDSAPIDWMTRDGKTSVLRAAGANWASPRHLVNPDGTGDVTRLTDSPNFQTPGSWHPNGKILAFRVRFDSSARAHSRCLLDDQRRTDDLHAVLRQ